MAKKKAKIEGFINQDGWSWNVDFFQRNSEKDCIDHFTAKGYPKTTIIAVHKQANGSTVPNKVEE